MKNRKKQQKIKRREAKVKKRKIARRAQQHAKRIVDEKEATKQRDLEKRARELGEIIERAQESVN